jgi:mono/diheme cytochrome c family protein
MIYARLSIAFTAAAPFVFWAAAAVSFSSCKNTEENAAPLTPEQALVARGRTIYQSVCIACHNTDPKKAGALGPEVWGASLELLTARITKAEYPAGYTPKRTTHVMQPLPQVVKDIPAVQAYLNQP